MEIKVRGRLGADPEMKTTSNGSEYASFSLAYTPRKRVNNEWIDGETQWYKVTAWDKKSAKAAMLKKGDAVLICGTVKLSTYTNREGIEKTVLEITASEIYAEIKTEKVMAAYQPAGEAWDTGW